MACDDGVQIAKFEWLDSYEIGHKEIDDDHRHMFSIMRQVEAAGRELRFECCAVLLDELVAFTRVHFAREEALLQRIGFPAAKQHKAYHARLLARAENVKEVCKVIKSEQTFLDCCEEMFSFLIDDILTGDLAIKAYLQETGVAERC